MIFGFLLSSILAVAYCEECTDFDGYWTRADALACYETSDFSAFESTFRDIATKYSGGSEYYLDYAVFRQRLKAGLPNFSGSEIDLTAEMEVLKTKIFDSRFTAEVELNDIFRLTRDAHFNLRQNWIVRRSAFHHPVGIASDVVGGVQKFYFKTTGDSDMTLVQTEYNSAYETSHDFVSLDGEEITSINGQDPKVAIKEICDNFANSRDDSTCLNELIREKWWKRSKIDDFGVPTSSITYEYGSSGSIELDFVSCVSDCNDVSGVCTMGCVSIGSNTDYNNQVYLWARRGSDYFEGISSIHSRDEELSRRGREKAKRMMENRASGGRRAPSTTPLCGDTCSTGACSYEVYKFDDVDDTIVMYFSSMETGNDVGYMRNFKDCMKDTINGGGYTNLILDLRENGGGTIFWGMYIISGLMNRTMVESDYLMGPLVMTKHLTDNVQSYFANFWNYEVVSNSGNVDYKLREVDGSDSTFSSIKWFHEGVTQYYMGSEGATSLKDYSSFEGFDENNFIILLDGSCGSTCGMMVKTLHAAKAARTVLYGGFKDDDFDVTSFEGSGVMAVSAIKDYRFSWGAYMNPTFDGLFDKSKLNFTEWSAFSMVNADHRVENWEQFDPENDYDAPYDAITGILPKCVDWMVEEDPTCTVVIEHGVYGRPCGGDGEFDMGGECMLKRCDEGYYMDEARTKCTAIGDAPKYDVLDESQKVGYACNQLACDEDHTTTCDCVDGFYGVDCGCVCEYGWKGDSCDVQDDEDDMDDDSDDNDDSDDSDDNDDDIDIDQGAMVCLNTVLVVLFFVFFNL